MDYKKCSDTQLLKAYRKGDRQAIDALLSRHRRRLLDYIAMMVRDRDVAADIEQETLIKVMRFIDEGRYVDNGKFVSWALRIAHNQVIDHFRRLKQQNTVSHSTADYDLLNTPRFSDPTIEDKMIRGQIERDVRNLIRSLPEEQAEVVRMRYCLGWSFKEIAEKTGVSINTALGRMRYALINMRKTIEQNRMVLQ